MKQDRTLLEDLRAFRDSLHAKGDPMGKRAVERCVKIVQRHEKSNSRQTARLPEARNATQSVT